MKLKVDYCAGNLELASSELVKELTSGIYFNVIDSDKDKVIKDKVIVRMLEKANLHFTFSNGEFVVDIAELEAVEEVCHVMNIETFKLVENHKLVGNKFEIYKGGIK